MVKKVTDNQTLEEVIARIQDLLRWKRLISQIEENKNIFGEDISGEIKRCEKLLDSDSELKNLRFSEIKEEKLRHKLLQKLIKKRKLNIWIERNEDHIHKQELENSISSPMGDFNEIIEKLRKE